MTCSHSSHAWLLMQLCEAEVIFAVRDCHQAILHWCRKFLVTCNICHINDFQIKLNNQSASPKSVNKGERWRVLYFHVIKLSAAHSCGFRVHIVHIPSGALCKGQAVHKHILLFSLVFCWIILENKLTLRKWYCRSVWDCVSKVLKGYWLGVWYWILKNDTCLV